MVSENRTPDSEQGDGSPPVGGSADAGHQDPGAQAYAQAAAYALEAYGQVQHPPSPGPDSRQNPYPQSQQGWHNPYGEDSSGARPAASAHNQDAQAYPFGAKTAPPPNPYGQSRLHGAPHEQAARAAGGQRPPMNPGTKKRIILFSALAAGLVLLLIIGAVVVNVINRTQYGPEATVRSYLAAISQGKASQANELVDPGVGKNAASLLADDILGESKALMKNAKVTKVSTRGDSAFAEVSYSIDGTAFDDVLELSKDGKQGVLFDKWKIDKPLLSSVYVYTNQGTTVSVNGTDVDFGKEYELAAYPGVYEIGAPEGNFFEAESQTFVAGTGSKANYEAVELDLVPSEGLTQAVQEALNAHLDACAASKTDDPEGCGMYTGARYDFADEPTLKYTVEKYPVVTVDEFGAHFSTEGGKVTATATGTLYGGGTGTESYTTDEGWNLSGSIVIDGDEVTLEDVY